MHLYMYKYFPTLILNYIDQHVKTSSTGNSNHLSFVMLVTSVPKDETTEVIPSYITKVNINTVICHLMNLC